VSFIAFLAGMGTSSALLVFSLILIGFVILAVEVFVLPGFGVAGILGLLFLIGGSIAAWMVFGAGGGLLVIIVSWTIVIGGGVILARSRAGKRLVLTTVQERGKGSEARDLARLVGQRGVATSDLRPAGIATFGDERVDVVTDGVYVVAGTPVKVLAVEGPRVVVQSDTTEDPNR